MNILLRKIKNAPLRLISIYHKVRFVMDGFWKALGEAIRIYRILKNTEMKNQEIQKIAVINAARSYPVTDIELYFAHLLSLNGVIVYVLFDDGVLEHWDSTQFNKLRYYSPYKAKWNIRLRHIIRKKIVGLAYKNRRIHYLNYSSIVKKVKPDTVIDAKDTSYALSSTKRFFQTGIIDLDKEEHSSYYEKSLHNCAVSRAVAKYTLKYLKPDLYITSHGIYSVWGPAYRIMKEAGIPVIVWQIPGTTIGHIRLLDRHNQILASTQDWINFNEKCTLTPELLRIGNKLLLTRFNFNTKDTREYFERKTDTKSYKKVFKSSNRINFAMFPNVVWDGDIIERNLYFNNVIEWCEYTINIIKKTNNHLFIRFHPSEVTRLKGTIKLEDIIRDRVPNIDSFENVTLISSSEPMSTYSFAHDNVDIGLIYDGTLCLELTYLGIPTIASTNGNFTWDKIVYKPNSIEQYYEWLVHPRKIIEKFRIEKEKRIESSSKYAYWLFKESLIAFKPIEKPYPIKINYKLIRKDEALSTDEERIINRLISPISNI